MVLQILIAQTRERLLFWSFAHLCPSAKIKSRTNTIRTDHTQERSEGTPLIHLAPLVLGNACFLSG